MPAALITAPAVLDRPHLKGFGFVLEIVLNGAVTIQVLSLFRGRNLTLPFFLRLAAMQINAIALAGSRLEDGQVRSSQRAFMLVFYTLAIVILLHIEAISLYVYYDTWFRFYTVPKGANITYRLLCLALDTGIVCSLLTIAYMITLLTSNEMSRALSGCVMQTACLSISSLSVFVVTLPKDGAPIYEGEARDVALAMRNDAKVIPEKAIPV
ncbi:hypothetical protein K488DRAFT_89281 [Vararia minispora EC-137]|uniref:Uncharacterized protein n=1 Tax=Vararia minispora EC-137 TaxID=1314806 RepID=A0ACB8QAN3_9AGAM|nr:hypothetical protein K488DRAFT_89281 [Vararia minispora EC-137]